jgi:hypothetical protein
MSIAHLGDSERMFFVSLLLNEMLGWMRKQQGTTSLRALLYMDEVAGYMPPVASPPSKLAFLTLLKQARAYGLGVVAATQNPVDLDYKGLSNTGTWFLGRLQTDQDKARVLDGIEGALAGRTGFDRSEVDRMLSGLGKRVFLLHNVHEDAPEVFETRWTMSYLRGPLTRDQIRALMAPVKAAALRAATGPPRAGGTPSLPVGAVAASRGPRPVLPPDVPQLFVPARTATPAYDPRLWASAQVEFTDTKRDVRATRTVARLTPFCDGPVGVDWDAGEPADMGLSDLETEPVAGCAFAELPPAAAKAKSYASWSKDFARWLYQTQQMELLHHPGLDLTSRPDEGEREFRIRLQLAAREARDAEKARLQQKYAPRAAALQDRLRRARLAVEKEAEQASHHKMQSLFSAGASVLGALLGRKVISASTVGKAATVARGFGRARKEAQDVKRAEDTVEACEQQLAELEGELQAETAALDVAADVTNAPLDKVAVKPKKSQITVGQVVLAWVPRQDG